MRCHKHRRKEGKKEEELSDRLFCEARERYISESFLSRCYCKSDFFYLFGAFVCRLHTNTRDIHRVAVDKREL